VDLARRRLDRLRSDLGDAVRQLLLATLQILHASLVSRELI
jgi:hypothetical protein